MNCCVELGMFPNDASLFENTPVVDGLIMFVCWWPFAKLVGILVWVVGWSFDGTAMALLPLTTGLAAWVVLLILSLDKLTFCCC